MEKNIETQKEEQLFWKALKPYFISTLICIIIVRLFIFAFHPYFVSGSSMNPTYHSGQLVFCEQNDGNLKRGDVVIIHLENDVYIKRIIACPGDHICILDGYVYVNGQKEEGMPKIESNYGILAERILLGEDEYICLGDNRNDSYDSRRFGPVSSSDIKYIVKK